MSEEEKKAIEIIKDYYQDFAIEHKYPYLRESIDTILELIEDQQKEIEELKSLIDENHFLKEMYRGTTEYKAIKKKVEELGWN